MSTECCDIAVMDTQLRTVAGTLYENSSISSVVEEMVYNGKKSSYPLSLRIFTSAVLMILCVLILCGNSLVLCSVLRYPTLRIPTNMGLCALAVSDIMVGISIIFLMTGSFGGYTIYSRNYIECQLSIFFIMLPPLSTNLLMCGKKERILFFLTKISIEGDHLLELWHAVAIVKKMFLLPPGISYHHAIVYVAHPSLVTGTQFKQNGHPLFLSL